jgi:hypothetical protein
VKCRSEGVDRGREPGAGGDDLGSGAQARPASVAAVCVATPGQAGTTFCRPPIRCLATHANDRLGSRPAYRGPPMAGPLSGRSPVVLRLSFQGENLGMSGHGVRQPVLRHKPKQRRQALLFAAGTLAHSRTNADRTKPTMHSRDAPRCTPRSLSLDKPQIGKNHVS